MKDRVVIYEATCIRGKENNQRNDAHLCSEG